MIIAIDGPAAAGKGTLAKRLAAHFDLAFLDTGRLYRAVGYGILRAGGDPNDPKTAVAAARGLDPANVDTGDLYTEKVAEAASVIIQTTVFKLRRRRRGRAYAEQHRVFRMAPLHHHFEKIGWAETKVVTRFYIVGILCALFALSSLKIR